MMALSEVYPESANSGSRHSRYTLTGSVAVASAFNTGTANSAPAPKDATKVRLRPTWSEIQPTSGGKNKKVANTQVMTWVAAALSKPAVLTNNFCI